jgi:predicted Zn finger-like uncharacterized protein
MILTCPSCATSYFTPDDAIGPGGRRVRCKSCSHVWHASADEPLELNAATVLIADSEQAAITAAGPEPVAAPAGFGKRDDATESLAETPAPELPKAFRARAEQQRRLRRAAAHGAVWAGIASAFVALLSAGWLFRVEVVELYPRAAAAYAAVGAPVNPTGLEFEAITARAAPGAPDRVLVSGALRNVRSGEVVAPPVRLALLDAHGAEIGHAVLRIDAAPVLPGKVQGFAVLIADPGSKAAGVDVVFQSPEAARRPVPDSHAAPPAPAAAEPAHPAPRPLPTADEGGLRPALAPMPDPDDQHPVDAVPVHAPALDTTGHEAVSASHHG